MVLPEGFAIPPWYYTVPLVLLLSGVVALLVTIDPPVTDRTVIAFAPWMMLGSALHVLYFLGNDPEVNLQTYPDVLAPLFGSPTVYVTTAIGAGFVWIVASFLHAAGISNSIPRLVGITGTAFFSIFAIIILLLGYENGSLRPLEPAVSVLITALITFVAWIGLSLRHTEVAAVTSLTGILVIFSQTLDGVSTAIGYDFLEGFHEGVPLSRFILETAETLPTYDYIYAGWLFIFIKIGLALVVLGLFKEYVKDEPRRARIVLAFIAAVGLGPGVHNVLLFAYGYPPA